MSERYFVTGVQLGMINNKDVSQEMKDKIMNEIIDKQFITNAYTDKDKEAFENKLKEIWGFDLNETK